MKEVSIKLTTVQALELTCLLHHLKLREDAAPRFMRIKDSIISQAAAQLSNDELTETFQEANNLMDEYHFPDLISDGETLI